MDLQLISGLGLPGLLFLAAFVFMQIALTELLKVVLAKAGRAVQGGAVILLSLGLGAGLGALMLSGVASRAGIELTRPWSGMTLGAEPACRLPQTTLTPARGSIRRLSTAGSSVVTLASAKVRSPVRCGRLVWPPLPVSRTSTRSAALVSGPSRSPTWPTSTPGSQWRAKTRSTSSRAPSAMR